MPNKQIIIVIISGLLSAFSLASILNFTDPYQANWIVFAFFYLSLLLFSFSCLTLLAFLVKRWLWPKIYLVDFYLSIRQGALLAVFITISVALQLNGILFWWLEMSLILFLVVIEIFINLKQ